MTIENIKTVILILLLVLSSLLTWNIWTYQPKYDILEDAKTVQEVSLSGEEKAIESIVFPSKVFYHYGNEHYGTIYSDEINKVIKEIRGWNFDHFEEVSDELGNLFDFVNKRGNAEIVFPAVVPMEIFKSLIDIKDKDAYSIQFDRIIIDTNNVTKSHGNVYFVSLERELAYKAEVTASFVSNFREDFYAPASNNEYFYRHQRFELKDTRSLLVRSNPTKMKGYNYIIDNLSTEQFKDALFSDPSFVKRNVTAYGEEYYDESTLMSVNFTTNMLLYVDPAQEKGGASTTEKLLGQSVDFVNGHGGWTGNYRYAGMDTFEKTVFFKMYSPQGYPIFSNNGISEIYLIWGETGIIQYMRNNFTIGRNVETTELTMPSGVEVFNELMKKEGFQPEYLQDLVLGYKISTDSEGILLRLEPSWYYKYRDQWSAFPSESREG